MKIPSLCPKCNKPLVTDFSGNMWRKDCLQINHHFMYMSRENTPDEIDIVMLTIDLTRQTRVYFDFSELKVEVEQFTVNGEKKVSRIPFFEPDLNSYDKLVNKIKKYITFS